MKLNAQALAEHIEKEAFEERRQTPVKPVTRQMTPAVHHVEQAASVRIESPAAM